jgi:hypothetical protein
MSELYVMVMSLSLEQEQLFVRARQTATMLKRASKQQLVSLGLKSQRVTTRLQHQVLPNVLLDPRVAGQHPPLVQVESTQSWDGENVISYLSELKKTLLYQMGIQTAPQPAQAFGLIIEKQALASIAQQNLTKSVT